MENHEQQPPKVGQVGDILHRAAARAPVDAGVVDLGGGARIERTFAELDLAARRAAAHLRRTGIEPGDRVALTAGNSAGFVTAWFGVVYCGATVIPFPVLSAVPEVSYRLRHARARAIIFDGERASLANDSVAECGAGVQSIWLDALEVPSEPPIDAPEARDPDSAAMILYTSGTTGHAKGAAISHRTLLEHTCGLAEISLALTKEDRVLGVLPLTHSYGLRMVLLATFHAGCRCVLMPRFDAAMAIDAMRAEGVTWLPAVPTMLASFGALPAGERPEQLRWCLGAGAPLPDEILHRAERRLGTEIRQAYGMTEATISTMNAPPDERVVGSVGRPVPGVEVRVVDEHDRDVPSGQTGQVLVRGKNTMTGYLEDASATDEAMRGGWMHSGDIGRLDDEGRLYVVDRIKDLIIRGGNNVYPSEVESVLAEHPDVQEVAVVGRPDPYYGEEIVALIVPGSSPPDLEELRRFAAGRVARNKVPREWALVESLPLGPSRKVLKRQLRDWVTDGTIVPRRIGA